MRSNVTWKLAAAMAVCVGSLTAIAQPATEPAKQPEKKDAPATQPPAKADKPAEATPTTPAAPNKEQLVYVRMTTSMGDIVLELNKEKAPLSVDNFMKYAESGHYNGTIFHRVIPTFMIQGGGFDKDMKQKPTNPPIKNEWKNGLKNVRGSIACARTQVADSATSQFFINVQDNTFLDDPRDGAAYAVFGRVVSGMDTVDKIKMTPTTVKNGMGDVPATTVTIDKVVKLTDAEAAAVKK
jgi:cyclophilin family peptidyl-prolyl cis-trans isomerase